jgi:hypothetical protein
MIQALKATIKRGDGDRHENKVFYLLSQMPVHKFQRPEPPTPYNLPR